jgi:sRNA-binding protein
MKSTLSLKKPLSFEKQSTILQMMGIKNEIKKQSPENQNFLESTPKKKKCGFVSVKWLERTYPKCFNRKNPKPLKKGIMKDILMEGRWIESKTSLRAIVSFYVGSPLYHQAILEESFRYDLRGEKVEEIRESEKEFSKQRLDKELTVKN